MIAPVYPPFRCRFSVAGWLRSVGMFEDHDETCRREVGVSASGAAEQIPDGVLLVDRAQIRRAVAAAAVGNVTEWFDFGVYGYLATTIGEVFYPGTDPVVQQLAAFGTFAAAFLVRPLGGLFFGPLGDRIGRTRVLAATMLMMAAGTFGIGLVPDYRTIGMAAPVLLLLGRLVQGFSTGGEYAGAMTFVAEYSPDKRRGFLGSWLEVGTLAGYIMGAASATVLTTVLTHQDLVTWGWRVPFLTAAPLGMVGMYLRMKLGETPSFEKHGEQRRGDDAATGFRSIFVKHWRTMLLCVGLVLTYNVAYYLFSSFIPTFLTTDAHISETESNVVQIGVMVVMALVVTFLGRLSDRIGRRPLLGVACAALVVLSVPAVLLILRDTVVSVSAGLLVLGLEVVLFAAATPATLPALFPTGIRQGGLSIAYNVSVSLFGGTTPVVMTALINATGDPKWPGYYLMAAGAVAAITVFFVRESANRPLAGSPPTVETMAEARTLVSTLD
jgi:MFS transporter, MHS family, proline/betaine transporter